MLKPCGFCQQTKHRYWYPEEDLIALFCETCGKNYYGDDKQAVIDLWNKSHYVSSAEIDKLVWNTANYLCQQLTNASYTVRCTVEPVQYMQQDYSKIILRSVIKYTVRRKKDSDVVASLNSVFDYKLNPLKVDEYTYDDKDYQHYAALYHTETLYKLQKLYQSRSIDDEFIFS